LLSGRNSRLVDYDQVVVVIVVVVVVISPTPSASPFHRNQMGEDKE
jgi:hypothetical protein